MSVEDFESIKKTVLSSIGKTLIEKNKRYGNAALEPVNVFYKGDASTSILIRLDDKYSRVLNSDKIRINDLYDILGYLFLLSISNNYFGTDAKIGFDKKIAAIQNEIFANVKYESISDNGVNAFTKCSNSLIDIDRIINSIKTSEVNENRVLKLMYNIVTYFIENNITDFSNLVD